MKVEQTTRKSGKLKIDTSKSTSGVSITPENSAVVYSDKILETALALKATYGTKYSDQYYLDYATRMSYIGMVERFSAPRAERISACPIQDPDWQGYSYEEIIEMENNGVQIPQDVVLWAHAQQESDIVAYDILETEENTDDNSTTEEVTDGFDVTALQKNAQKYTTKAEKAQKEAIAQTEEFNVLAQKAEKIKKEKQDTYKNELRQITALTDEWKKLEEKNKSNSLTSSEQKRYKELSQTLKGNTNNSTMKEIKFDSAELDELLASMDSLDAMIVENLETSADVIKAGEELSKFEKRFHSGLQIHSSQSYQIASPGNLESNIGTPNSSIAELAVSTGKDLEHSSNEVTSLISNEASEELKTFAQDYSRAAKEALKSSNQVDQKQPEQGDKDKQVEDYSETSKTNTEKSTAAPAAASSASTQNAGANTQAEAEGNELGSNKGYFVFPASGRPEAAIAATVVSAISTADLKNKQGKVNATEKGLKKDLKKTQADVKKLLNNNKKMEASHAMNMQKVAGMNQELDNLYNQKTMQMEQAMQSAKSQKRSNGSKGEIELPQMDFSQEEGLISEISSVSAQDAVMKQTLKLEKTRVQNSITKNEKTTQKLGEQDKQLKERNKNNKTVGINTVICGSLTTTLGAYNMAMAVPMLSQGLAMMSFPPTAAAGAVLAAFATKWIIFASAQLLTGPGAITAGSIGIASSNDVSDDLKKHEQSIKDSNAQSLANHRDARQTDKLLKNWDAIEIPSLAVPSMNSQMAEDEPQFEAPQENGTSATKNVTFGTVKDITKPQGNNPNTIYNSMPVSGKKQNNQTAGLAQTPEKQGSAQKQTVQNPQFAQQQTNAEKQPQKTSPVTAANRQNAQMTPAVNANAQQVQAEQTPKAQKDNIIAQLRTNDREGQALENSADDNSNKVLRNNHSKSQTLSRRFEELNEEIQAVNVQQDEDKEIKALQNEFTKDSSEVEKLVQSASARVANASKTSSEETPVENQNISEADVTAIIKDVYSEEEIASRTTEDDDTNVLAASASTNAGIVKNTTTDDKVERKLARFNNDSIIESRKKMKKVQAVSAASGGRGK